MLQQVIILYQYFLLNGAITIAITHQLVDILDLKMLAPLITIKGLYNIVSVYHMHHNLLKKIIVLDVKSIEQLHFLSNILLILINGIKNQHNVIRQTIVLVMQGQLINVHHILLIHKNVNAHNFIKQILLLFKLVDKKTKNHKLNVQALFQLFMVKIKVQIQYGVVQIVFKTII